MAITRRPTVKQMTRLRDYIRTGSREKTVELDGLRTQGNPADPTPYAVDQTLQSPTVRSLMKQALRQQGLDESCVAVELKKMLRATRKQYFADKGVVISSRTNADNGIRLRAIEMVANLLEVDQEPTGVNINNITINQLNGLSDAQLDELVRIAESQRSEIPCDWDQSEAGVGAA